MKRINVFKIGIYVFLKYHILIYILLSIMMLTIVCIALHEVNVMQHNHYLEVIDEGVRRHARIYDVDVVGRNSLWVCIKDKNGELHTVVTRLDNHQSVNVGDKVDLYVHTSNDGEQVSAIQGFPPLRPFPFLDVILKILIMCSVGIVTIIVLIWYWYYATFSNEKYYDTGKIVIRSKQEYQAFCKGIRRIPLLTRIFEKMLVEIPQSLGVLPQGNMYMISYVHADHKGFDICGTCIIITGNIEKYVDENVPHVIRFRKLILLPEMYL